MTRSEAKRVDGWRLRLPPTALILAFAIAPGVTAVAEDEKLPSAEEILARYVEATGGRKAYENIRTKVTRAHFKPPESETQATQIGYYSEPSNFFQETLGAPGGIRREGVSGDVVWYINPKTGPAIRDGILKDRSLRHAFLHRDLEWRKLYKEAKCTGTATIEGKECYKVAMTATNDDHEIRYFAKDSGLHIATDVGTEGPMGGMQIRILFSEYRKTGALLVPFRWVQSFGGLEIEVVYESIEFNVEIPPSRFVLPPEVETLRKNAQDG